jgi:hypothetical protein
MRRDATGCVFATRGSDQIANKDIHLFTRHSPGVEPKAEMFHHYTITASIGRLLNDESRFNLRNADGFMISHVVTSQPRKYGGRS